MRGLDISASAAVFFTELRKYHLVVVHGMQSYSYMEEGRESASASLVTGIGLVMGGVFLDSCPLSQA